MWGWVLAPKWRQRNKQLLLMKCKVLLKAPGVGKANYVIQSKLLEIGKCVTVDNVDVFEEKSSLWNSHLLCGRQQGVPAVLVVFLHCSSLGGQEQFVSAWQHWICAHRTWHLTLQNRKSMQNKSWLEFFANIALFKLTWMCKVKHSV